MVNGNLQVVQIRLFKEGANNDAKYLAEVLHCHRLGRWYLGSSFSYQGGFAEPRFPDHHQIQLEAFLDCFSANLDGGSLQS